MKEESTFRRNANYYLTHTLKEKGITLVALVVTVVVLLILAGITINALLGENSIFDLAKEAAEKTKRENAIQMAQLDILSEQLLGNVTEGKLEKILSKYGTVEKDDEGKITGLKVEGVEETITIGEIYTEGVTLGTPGNPGEDTEGTEKPGGEGTPQEPTVHPTEGSTQNPNVTVVTNFGKIDIIWLQGETNTPSREQEPNDPNLYNNGLTPVTWTKSGTTWTKDTTPQATWYNYQAGTGTSDNLESHWANATNGDGSYFVWIPRYAYRITYYNKDYRTDSTAVVKGYYDGFGMWNAETGELKYELESGVETVDYGDYKYIVHPAFGAADTSKQADNINQGGCGNAITGFWVAKFEMSGETNGTASTPGDVETSTTIKAVSKPGVSSWRSIKIGNCYTNSYKYDRSKESHLIKNSEWGAVAYLTHSQYGRNGHEIGFSNVGYNTGGGSGATAYLGGTNILQSTTGNPYGVYDLRGGAYEYTAAWDTLAEDSNNRISTNGSSFASKNGVSTKYATAYSNGTSTYKESSGTKNVYNVSKTGDGIKEVYVSGSAGWFSDYSNFAYSSVPFFARGGDYYGFEAHTGVFYSIPQRWRCRQRLRVPCCALPVACDLEPFCPFFGTKLSKVTT